MAHLPVLVLLILACLLWFQPWTSKEKSAQKKQWWEYLPPVDYYVQAFQSPEKTMADAEKEYRRKYGQVMPEPLERHFRESKNNANLK